MQDIESWKIITYPYEGAKLRVNIMDKYNRYSNDVDLYLDVHNLIKEKRLMPNKGDIITMDNHMMTVKYVNMTRSAQHTFYTVTLETYEPIHIE